MTIKNPMNNRRSTRILLLSGAGLSPIERMMGRAMRSPDEHAAADADAAAAEAEEPAASALGAAAAEADAGKDEAAAAATDADKTDADKAAAADAAKADAEKASAEDSIVGAPDDYDTTAFAMPEGVEFDAEMFDLVKDDLKGMDLSQKGAEQVVGIFAAKVAPKIEERAVKAIDDAGAQLRANLARDLQADPEVGGTKLKESQAYAAKAFAHFVPKAEERAQLSQFLNESGLGDHPLLTRVIAGAGRALSEASVPAGAGGAQERTAAEKFYGRNG